MPFVLVNSEDNRTLLFSIILALVFFFYIMPKIEANAAEEEAENAVIREAMASLKANDKLDTSLCSRKCCNIRGQWPIPFNRVEDSNVSDKDLKKYQSSNYMCNHGIGGGCVCVENDTWNYLGARGENAVKL